MEYCTLVQYKLTSGSHLCATCSLCAWQVSEAIQERAKRIYDKYGNVMLDVKGMTKAGIERKATCQALFAKLLYLAGNVLLHTEVRPSSQTF